MREDKNMQTNNYQANARATKIIKTKYNDITIIQMAGTGDDSQK